VGLRASVDKSVMNTILGRSATACTAAAMALAVIGPVSAEALPPSKSYSNCTALHSDFPHGVGRSGAHDRVRGSTRPVTNFTRNTQVYNQNQGSDRDGDGVACEQH
jgi:hypothetical protein